MSPIAYEMRRKFMQRERQRRCRDKRKNQSTRLKSCANDFGVLLEENKNLKKRVEQLDRRINIIKATINNPE
jgi:predicted RNase H-like nuclease (RuvC/YqgF family)